MREKRDDMRLTACQVPALVSRSSLSSRPSLDRLDLLRRPRVLMREGNLLSRLCYYFSYSMTANRDTTFSDVGKRVLASNRVRDAIKKSADQDIQRMRLDGQSVDVSVVRPVLESGHETRARSVLNQMKSCISSSLLTIAGWLLFKLLSRILTSIQFSKKQVDQIKKVRNSGRHPILYLPVHRSHLDYILVSFILHMNGVKPPLVAAGDNLKIPLFGNLMKGLGAFFIKRKLDPKQGQRDHIYRAVLESYMTENLRSGECMEFFLEGGRSRTGKALVPKSGLLSVVVNAVLEREVDDVIIVPVGISYDKLIDGSFVSEQLGKSKVKESFTLAAKAVWATLRSNFGSARVDFGHPFSLREYLRTASDHMMPCILHSDSVTRVGYMPGDIVSVDNSKPGLRSVSSSASLYGLEVVLEGQKRQVIQNLAEHVVHEACHASAIMSTQMLAFVLLTYYRKGASLTQLAPAMTWLKKELLRKGRDVGFSGEAGAVIKYACSLLGRDLVTTEVMQMAWSSSGDHLSPEDQNSRNSRKLVLVKPATKVPAVLELQYYSNAVASSFALESIVVNALFALHNWGVDAVDEIECNNNHISRENLQITALELCHILKYEFILSPPCVDIETALSDVIDDFISRGLLSPNEPPPHSMTRAYDWEDDDGFGMHAASWEEKVMVEIGKPENIELLTFYRSIISPFVESYWLAAKSLFRLVGKTMDYSAFNTYLMDEAKEQMRNGLLVYQESIAAEPLKNSISMFENKKILERKSVSGSQVVYLTREHDNEDAIIEVIKSIEKFKK